MSRFSRRGALTCGAGVLLGLGAYPLVRAGADAAGTARSWGRERIPYGACLRLDPLRDDLDYRVALRTYCQQLTPEGGLLWVDLRPTPDQFHFAMADAALAFADANEMTLRGHTLVWYGAMPAWTNDIASAADAERAMTLHIERVVSRYRGKIKTWHVVNEAIDDPKGSVPGLRPNVWLRNLGERYIDLAFRTAHRADPDAELILNDFDMECADGASPHKREALRRLVHALLDRGAPLHGIGLQGHIKGQNVIDRDGLSALVADMHALGLSVHVTELDVIDGSLPGPVPVRDSIVAARAYDFLDAIVAAARPAFIGTWGITDRYTWVPTWYKRKDGLPNRPLPLDADYRPKPLWSVIDYFCGK